LLYQQKSRTGSGFFVACKTTPNLLRIALMRRFGIARARHVEKVETAFYACVDFSNRVAGID
jgi:hypothetical protein